MRIQAIVVNAREGMSRMARELFGGRISRRSLIRGSALGGVGLATAAVIGCGDADDDAPVVVPAATAAPTTAAAATAAPTATPTAAPEKKSEKITPAVVAPGNTLDPNTTAGSTNEFHGIYDTLARLDPVTNSIIPALGESYEVDPSDPARWIFNLREAEFSDGVKLTAEDVKFALEYYQDADNKSSLRSRVSTVDHVEVMDERTAVLVTAKADPIIPRRQHLVFILPKHIFEDPSKGRDYQADKAVGSGAYFPASYTQGANILLEASASSWRGTKGIDIADMQVIKESTTRLSALETGDVDFATGLPIPELERIEGFDNVVLGANPSTQWRGWSMEYFDPPTSDVRVRLALEHALDTPTVIEEIYFGRAVEQRSQPLTENTFGFNPDLQPYGYDPDKSRELLRDAGLPDGFKTTISSRVEGNPVFEAHTLAAADDISEIGIDISIEHVETGVWRDGIYGRAKRTPHIYHMPFSAFVLADASFAYSWLQKDAASKYYDNPKFESKFVEGLSTIDTEARRKLYQEATYELSLDPVALWTVHAQAFHAWREDKFAVLHPAGQPGVFFDQIEPV